MIKKLMMGLVVALGFTTPANAYYTAGVEANRNNADGGDQECSVTFTQSYADYWVRKLDLTTRSWEDTRDYHNSRTNGNNFSAAALCWMDYVENDRGYIINPMDEYGFTVDMEELSLMEQAQFLAMLRSGIEEGDEYISSIGYIHPSYLGQVGDNPVWQAVLDHMSGATEQNIGESYGVIPLPSDFSNVLADVAPYYYEEFQQAWARANNPDADVMDLQYDAVTDMWLNSIAIDNAQFLMNWIDAWNSLDDEDKANKAEDFAADIAEYF